MSNYSAEAKGIMNVTSLGGDDGASASPLDTTAGVASIYANFTAGIKGHGKVTIKREDTNAIVATATCKGGEAASTDGYSTWGAGIPSGTSILVEWSFGGVFPAAAQVFQFSNGDLVSAGAAIQGNGHVEGQARFVTP